MLLYLPVNGPKRGSNLYGQAPSLEIKNFNKNKIRKNKTKNKPQNWTLNLVLHITTEAYLENHLPLSPSLPALKWRTFQVSLKVSFTLWFYRLSNLLTHASLIQTHSCTDSTLYYMHALTNLTSVPFTVSSHCETPCHFLLAPLFPVSCEMSSQLYFFPWRPHQLTQVIICPKGCDTSYFLLFSSCWLFALLCWHLKYKLLKFTN